MDFGRSYTNLIVDSGIRAPRAKHASRPASPEPVEISQKQRKAFLQSLSFDLSKRVEHRLDMSAANPLCVDHCPWSHCFVEALAVFFALRHLGVIGEKEFTLQNFQRFGFNTVRKQMKKPWRMWRVTYPNLLETFEGINDDKAVPGQRDIDPREVRELSDLAAAYLHDLLTTYPYYTWESLKWCYTSADPEHFHKDAYKDGAVWGGLLRPAHVAILTLIAFAEGERRAFPALRVLPSAAAIQCDAGGVRRGLRRQAGGGGLNWPRQARPEPLAGHHSGRSAA
jgi:hypothetical protein